MKTQHDIIIRRAFEIYIKDGTEMANEAASYGDRVNYRPLSLKDFKEVAYKDKCLDLYLDKAKTEYMEIVTQNLHTKL